MAKILIGLILALVAARGLYLLNNGIHALRSAGASSGWPKTEGVVVRTDDARNDRVFSTKANVRYRGGDGKEYSTDLISFGDNLNPIDRTRAGFLRECYPDGSKVSVFYDPSQPWAAVLRPGLHAEAFWPLGVALAFLLPAALCLMQFPAISRSLDRGRESNRAFQEMVGRARREGVKEMTFSVPPGSPIPMPGGGGGAVGAIVASTFAGLACGLGIIALAAGLPKLYYGYASVNWPTTRGEVTVNVGPTVMMERRVNRDMLIFPPGFLYQYEVAGTKHVNSVRRFRSVGRGSVADARDAQEAAPEDLPVGTRVPVSYFPTDPDISALDPGTTKESFILPGIGMAVLLLGVATFVWLLPSVLRS